jgi:hypothetical protein
MRMQQRAADLYSISGIDMTPGPYEARYLPGTPTACCDFAVISTGTGREVCRVWDRDDVERLTALLNGWQPIETAPKNATEVLLLCPRGGRGWPSTMRIVGHYAEDLSGSDQPPFKGWFQDTGYGFRQIEPPPTHWAPLSPELPERISATSSGSGTDRA